MVNVDLKQIRSANFLVCPLTLVKGQTLVFMLTIAKQAATIAITNQYDNDHTSPLSIDHHSVVTSRLIANTDQFHLHEIGLFLPKKKKLCNL